MLTFDSYKNIITGLGTEVADPTLATQLNPQPWLNDVAIDTLYTSSAVARRIVDRVVDDATRVKWEAEGDEGYDWSAVRSEVDDLNAMDALAKAWKWARAYGGAGVILAFEDARDYSEPVTPGSKLTALSPVSGVSLVVDAYNTELGTAGLYAPEMYRLLDGTDRLRRGSLIHPSRVLRFDGVEVPPHVLQNNWGVGLGWGPSVLQTSHTEIRRLDTTLAHAEAILQKVSVLAVKIEGWRNMIAGEDGEAKGKQILRNLMNGVSNLRMLGLDTADEMIEIKRSLDGVAMIVDKQTDAVVRESNQPRLVVLGESPPGALGDRGSAEAEAWNNHTAAERRAHLTPALTAVLDAVLAHRAANGEPVPAKYTLDYESLDQPNRKEEAEIDQLDAQTDQVLVLNQIATPEEIRTRWEEKGRLPPRESDPLGIDWSALLADPASAAVDPLLAAAPGPSTDEAPDDLVSVREAAARFGIPTRTLTRLIETQTLRYWGFGKRRQVSLAEVAQIGKAHEQTDRVEQQGAFWVVLSGAGELLGTHETEEAARAQLAAIEAAAHA